VARPDVTLYAPEPLFVGKPFTVHVDIKTAKETKVDFIDARLRGEQGWRISAGKTTITERRRYPDLGARLMGQGVLPAETTTRLSAQFTLPEGTPPTHELPPAWGRMMLKIHIAIPWRLDGHHQYAFAVRVPAGHIDRTPLAAGNTTRDAPPGNPRIEVALASTRVIAGETLVGSLAVFHLDDRKPRTWRYRLCR
jgi:hypothetical protein